MTKKATRKIKSFNFEGEGAHVALVDKSANNQSVLVMKSAKASEEEIQKALSKDVTVKMTIMQFLTRYLDIWFDDAEVVAGLLGYTAEELTGDFEYTANDLVDYIQDNIDSVQINKSADQEVMNKLTKSFADFQSKYLQKNSQSSVTSQDEDVAPTEDKTINKEDSNHMSVENTEMTQKSLEEMIQKAAKELAQEQVEALEKAYAEKAEETSKELQVLKAAHEARTAQEYLTKAAEYAQYLGEDADKEAIAKALRAVEGVEDAAPVLEVLKALKEMVSKEDILEEVGKSATDDQPSDFESKVEAVQKSLVDEGMSKAAAYVKAYDTVSAESK